MSRFLHSGIAVRIIISERKNNLDSYCFNKEKTVILKALNKIIDTTLYGIRNIENSIVLEIKEDIYEDNIHNLLKEVAPYMKIKKFLDNKDISLEEFNQQNYPIHIGKYIAKSVNKELKYIEDINGYYYINVNESNYEIKSNYNDIPDRKLLYYHYDKWHNLDILIEYMEVGFIFGDIDGENEFGIINMLNEFSKSFFHTELSKALLFYIY